MAGLEPLQQIIYHEKQQDGSMLCAQHALNSLLQGNYFTAPDLSAIARSLDDLEQSYDDNNRGASTNMDDTGFFSVQVLENALDVWGLTLQRWRSEAMRPYHDHPHTQLGFILNLNQHWFTLRRFGAASPNPDDMDSGQGHWFNLNSSLEGPEWVGKLYLSMVIQQAEAEGYSVFVVMQSDPYAPLALPRTEADELAARLPEPTSASTSRPQASGQNTDEDLEGEDVELQAALQDMDLQAALQASLMTGGHLSSFASFPHSESGLESPLPLPVPPPLLSNSGRRWHPMASGSQTPTQLRQLGSLVGDSSASASEAVSPTNEDHIAASMARNRSIMERMRLEQEMALQDNYQDVDMEEVAARQRREADEEEEMIRRAIAESETLHQQQPQQSEDDMVTEGESREREASPESDQTPIRPGPNPNRVYDDEDAELQAALRASLEDVPEGYQLPTSPPPRMVLPPHEVISTQAEQILAATGTADSSDAGGSEVESETSSITSPEEERISVEEMRRRRLARFGV